ncbi:MAG TPA: DEAD/DEAH box helicase family protein [Streptosporangiaceae bacterium]
MTQTAGRSRSAFRGIELSRPLWPHQQRALDAFEKDRKRGDTSTYLVVPPGGGKTLIGLEALRRLGRPALVLCPNTAIQAQWIAQWHASFAPATIQATASRDLPTALTVLTYQSLCTIGHAEPGAGNGISNGDPGAGEPGGDAGPGTAAGAPALAVPHPRAGRTGATDAELLGLLHPNGRALIERLAGGGPRTVVLDECHHLLELWGRLLTVVLGQLDAPRIIGLTATPPVLMTTGQAELHQALFGSVDLEVSAPALVRSGTLAPYQELAYLARPTAAEADYIHGEAVRFAELRTDLLDPQFASTPFLGWLQARVVDRHGPGGAQVSWPRFEHDEPGLADAAIRLHVAGLLPLPDGARIREQHRRPPDSDDWVALIGDYCRHCLLASDDPRDEQAYEAIRRALPSVGYRLTRAGVRAGESPVDRVLARSEAKARAVTEILRAETAELGPRLRALVLCDFEEASGTLPARLTGVLPAEAGGARLALQALLDDEQAAALDPVLLTGRRVACGPDTAGRLLDWLRAADPDLDLSAAPADAAGGGTAVAEITAARGWEPRRYVPLITRFFTGGGSRCLIGTRALLGEGWDAPAVNVTIDLTAAATPTSVVQARGRALRLDPQWPGKVADNWGVVCVTGDHPRGAADYSRLVRKHDHYFALAGTGDIVSGISHVDPELSPYGPPPEADFDALNAAMLQRAAARDAARDLWAVGTPYLDEPQATVTVRTGRSLGLAGRATVPLSRPGHRTRLTGAVAAAGAAAIAAVAGGPVAAAVALAVALVLTMIQLGRVARRLTAVPARDGLEDIARATADALHQAGLTSAGSAAIVLEPLADGSYRARLGGVPAAESAVFTTALDEVLAPLAQPRYVVPRLIVAPPRGVLAAAGLAARRLVTGHLPGAVVYHAVPAALGARKQLAAAFEQAWNKQVSPGKMLFTGSPEGAGVLAAQRGDDPFAVTTQIRTLWR